MHYRTDEIYINGKTKRRLRWIVNAVWKGQITNDKLADKLLNEIIVERWPSIQDAEQALADAEQAFAESFNHIIADGCDGRGPNDCNTAPLTVTN